MDGPFAENQDFEVNSWIKFGMHLGVSAALHPYEYSKTLIQLGYEPIAAIPGKSWSGKPIMKLPNIFQYTGHIKRIDGFYGCYRGLAPKLVGSVVAMVVSERVADKLGLNQLEENKHDTDLSEEDEYAQFKQKLKRDIVVTVSGIVASHPFHVISVRMMAQFIGRETLYRSIAGSIVEIWKTEGISGFFAGLVPKLLADVACLVLSSSAIYIVNKFFIKDKLARQYNGALMQFSCSSLLYPLLVVSTCSTVSGSRLMAGQPPIMPAYANWVDCWNDLQARKELKRGGSLIWRTQIRRTPRISDGFVPLPSLARYQ
ncbi:mitochondrial carrier homolog 2 [Drosophila guanche]|uniref:Blast:Mitochondrial carrier homolog 2 n=1 Tax=Drosophila guanche TaxID=7266 RepID=A0A3B0JUP2_DROGU|nr:mitochondrial carrier homolog 2 [Drosophila guanche]SPP84783.1 blast:Mitochondrial carrier homolog 2 [Drosophila guanche]